jgi:hypothetical protein
MGHAESPHKKISFKLMEEFWEKRRRKIIFIITGAEFTRLKSIHWKYFLLTSGDPLESFPPRGGQIKTTLYEPGLFTINKIILSSIPCQ